LPRPQPTPHTQPKARVCPAAVGGRALSFPFFSSATAATARPHCCVLTKLHSGAAAGAGTVPVPGVDLDASGSAALAERCASLLRPGDGGDAKSVREALFVEGRGTRDAMRHHADGLAPLVFSWLGDGNAAVRKTTRRFLTD
ncbi:unnamed protein product, partial [Urochloa humidicola]